MNIAPIVSARPVAAGEARSAAPPLTPGQVVSGRVLRADGSGALVSLEGRTLRLDAAQTGPLAPGQSLTFQVVTVGPGTLALRRLDAGAPASGAADASSLSTLSAARRDLSAALTALGVTVDESNLQAAQALVRFGIALSAENLADVRRGRASRLVRLPETVALTKSLQLPQTPAILRALDTLLTARTDNSLMTITVPMRPDTAGIAAHLQMAARAATESVEHKLLSGDIDGARMDLRSHLLRQALAGDSDAEAAARHLEGQMLANAARAARAAQSGDGSGSILVAFVAATGPKSQYVEMHLTPRAHEDPEPGDQGNSEGTPGSAATLHLPTARLGMVTARLHLTASGALTCRLTASGDEGMRRIERSVGNLAGALTAAGFPDPIALAQPAAKQPAHPAPPRALAVQPLQALDLKV